MKKPIIKDKNILKYVEHLEKKLEMFSSKKVSLKLFLAVLKQADDMANLLSENLEIENPTTKEVEVKSFMDFHTLSSKDDKFFDRYMNILKIWRPLMKDLAEAEAEFTPEEIKKVEEKVSGSIADEFVFGNGKD
jgi:hypothetical protein